MSLWGYGAMGPGDCLEQAADIEHDPVSVTCELPGDCIPLAHKDGDLRKPKFKSRLRAMEFVTGRVRMRGRVEAMGLNRLWSSWWPRKVWLSSGQGWCWCWRLLRLQSRAGPRLLPMR